jgi:hypothetical protein
MKFSPIRKPSKPAFLRLIKVSGLEMPLSEILVNPSGILSFGSIYFSYKTQKFSNSHF